MFDSGCPQLKEEINSKAIGQKWSQQIIIPLSCYPGLDGCDYTNQLHTILPLAPPANHGIRILPPSPNKSKRLSMPTQPTKEMEMEMGNARGNFGGLLLNLADDRSGDETSAPTKKQARIILPALTQKEASTILPSPIEKKADTSPTTRKGAGTTPEKSYNP